MIKSLRFYEKINKSIKLIALLVVCMAMPTLAGAQVLKTRISM